MAYTDIGIDLGTANIVMSRGNKGVVLNEASAVAYNHRQKRVIAVGNDAVVMEGRAPDFIEIVRPLSEGVISDDEMTQAMIKEFIWKVSGRQLVRPRIILCIPAFITDVESKAVVDAALGAGSRQVYLIQEPIAAMLGAGVDISQANGNIVVDIGGGTTDIAVISLNGIVESHSIKVAGNTIDDDIIRYIFTKYRLLIGKKTAENIKINFVDMLGRNPKKTLIVKGKNTITGLPERLMITQSDIFKAVKPAIMDIIEAIRVTLEKTPPELISDIYTNGMLLAGGGSMLTGLPDFIYRETGVQCHVAENAIECVANGTGMAFGQLDTLLDGFEYIKLYQY